MGKSKDPAYRLNERNKELNCIYEFTDLLNQSDMKLDEMMDQILHLIQSAMEFPPLTNVLIRVKDKEYKTQNFKNSVWKISNKVIEGGNDVSIEVYSIEDKHFPTEKTHLIEDIAFKLKIFLDHLFQNKTEQNLAGEKLKESEKKYKELFNHMTSGVAVYDVLEDATDFIIKDINKAGEEIDKISKEEIIDKKVTEAFPSVKDIGLFDVFKRVWKTGIPENHPISLYKDDRVSHWVENYVYKLPTGQIVAVYDNVTEKKIAEIKLNESVEEFRSIFINSPIGIELYGSDGKLVDANRACLDMFGASDVNSVKGFDLFQDPNVSEDVKMKLRTGETVRYESEFDFTKVKELNLYETSKSGIIDLDIFITPLYQSGTHSISSYLVQIQDITERKRAEFNLKESEEKFRMTFEQAAVGIAHVAPDGRFLRVNQKWCNIVGYTPEEMITRTFQEITHPDDLDADLEFVRQMLDREISTYSMEKRYFHKDGSIVWINLTVALLFEISGEPKYFISVIEDITDKKSTEEALQISEKKYAKLAQKLEVDLKETEFLAETLMERLPCIALLVRSHTREIIASNKYAKEVDAVPGKTCYSTWGQREDPCPWCLAPKAWETGEIHHLEVEALDVVWDAYWVPLKEDLYLHYAFDITEQKQAEETLNIERKFTEKAIDAQRDTFLIFDPSIGKTIRWNKAFKEISGYSDEEISKMMVPDSFYDKHDLEHAATATKKIIEGGEALFEMDLIRKDGRKIPFEYQASSINDDQGNLKYIISIGRDITERKQAEEALQESEKTLNRAQMIAHIGHWKLNPITMEVSGSDELFRIFDLSHDEATLDAFIGVVHPEDREYDLYYIQRGMETGESWDIEHRLLLRNGTIKWVRAIGESLKDEKGNIVMLIGTTQDISESKLIDQKLKESEEKYKKLANELEVIIDHFPGVIVYKDTENNILRVNKFLADSHNLKKEDMEGKNSFEFYPYETAQAYWEDDLKVISSKTPKLNIIEPWETLEGKRWVSTSKIPNIDENDNVKGILAIAMDITDQKKAEEEARLHSEIMTNMSEGVYLIRLEDLIIVYANPRFEEMFGYDPGEMIGKNVEIVNAPTDKTPEETKNEIVGILRDTGEWQGEVLNIKKDGGLFWCYANVSLFDHPNYGTVIISVHTDITERKKAEEALKRRENDLGERVKELTCLYRISNLTRETERSVESLVEESLKLIPSAWQFTDITCARISLNDKNYTTENFKETIWKQTDIIKVRNQFVGLIEVYYLKEMPESNEGPFLREERELINTLTAIIGNFIERKEAARILKVSEEKFSKAFHSIPTLMAITRMEDGYFLDVNETYTQSLGYSREELIGHTSLNLDLWVKPEQRKEFTKRLREDKRIEALDVDVYTKSGKILTMLFSGDIIYLNNSPHLITTAIDITDRRRAEQKLKESEEKYRKFSTQYKMLLESITDAVYALNRDWEYILVNKNAEEIINMPIENLLGNTIFEVFPGIEQTPFFKTYENVITTQTAERVINSFSRSDGYTGYYEVSVYPIEEGILCIAKDVTEEKIIEEKLIESELRYRSLFENMTSGFAYHKIIVDENNKPIDYEFLEANYAFEEFTGLKVENIIGKTVKEVLPGIENDSADWISKYGIVALTGIPMSFESYSTSLDKWYNVSAYSPKKYYFAVTFTNITERKNIERKIKESERKLRTIFEAIPDIFFLLTDDTTVIDYKAKIEDNLYIQPEEFIGKKLSEILPDNLGQLALEKVSTTIKIKQPQILEYSLSIKDEIHFYEARFLYLSKDQVAALVRDITDRKKDEEDLLIKDYALDSSINAIAISDLIGNLTFINPSFLKMWGYASEDEVLGKKSSSFWASEEKADQIIKDLKNKYSWSGELIGKKKNGSLFDTLLSASLVMDKNNNPICMMASFVDITERKRAEQLIIEENRKLKELSEMKRDIITRVSHELKTPLTSIHGASYYLLNFHKENMKEQVLEYLEIIHRGGLRLKSLVDDLIDISRLESGKMELKRNVVDITEIIKDCLKDITIFANHRNLTIKKDLLDEMLITVDKIRIGQVISNILSNSIKNTPPYGEISVNLNESKFEISIQVKDTGVGITEEERQLLFKKFGKIERYGKGMDVDTEGSGLGLFISKEIVELHNGSIFFESDGRNKGTTFTIILPKTK